MDFTRAGGNFGTSFTRTNQVDGLTAARQDVYSQMESRKARLLSIFSFAVLTPASMPTISERNVEVERRMQQTFFWGLVSPGQVDVDKVCKGGEVKAVKSQVAGIGLLANWLTAGIWMPMTVKVTCVYPTPGT